jgi:hypothetical protein
MADVVLKHLESKRYGLKKCAKLTNIGKNPKKALEEIQPLIYIL